MEKCLGTSVAWETWTRTGKQDLSPNKQLTVCFYAYRESGHYLVSDPQADQWLVSENVECVSWTTLHWDGATESQEWYSWWIWPCDTPSSFGP